MWMALPVQENLLSLPRAVARQNTEVRTGVCGRVFSIMSVFPGIDQGSWMRMNGVEVRGRMNDETQGKVSVGLVF